MFDRGQHAGRGARSRRWKLLGALAVVLCAAAGLYAGGLWWSRTSGAPWMARAMVSGSFLRAAAVFLGSIVLLGGLGVLLTRRRRRPVRGAEAGGVLIEFVAVIPILLMLVLILVQSSLLMGGNICVHYAAFCAARSAIVTIPIDADNEPRNVMLASELSQKFERIKHAAVMAVLPISAGAEEVQQADAGTLTDGLKQLFEDYGEDPPGWLDERLRRKLQYARDYTNVTIAPPVEGGSRYGPHEDIRVKVKHTLYLSVPYAARLFFEMPGGVDLGFAENEYGTEVEATCVLTNEGIRDKVDKELYTD